MMKHNLWPKKKSGGKREKGEKTHIQKKKKKKKKEKGEGKKKKKRRVQAKKNEERESKKKNEKKKKNINLQVITQVFARLESDCSLMRLRKRERFHYPFHDVFF